jgi:hypothetical protein
MKGGVGGCLGEDVVGGGLKRGRRRRRRRRLGVGGVAITGAAAAAGAEAESGAAADGAITDSAAGEGGEDAGAAVGATAAGRGGLAKPGGAIAVAVGAFDGERNWPMECRIGKACENVSGVGGTEVVTESTTEGEEGGWTWTGVEGDGEPVEEEEEARIAATSSRSREFSALSAATSRRSCCKVAVTSCPTWVERGSGGNREHAVGCGPGMLPRTGPAG